MSTTRKYTIVEGTMRPKRVPPCVQVGTEKTYLPLSECADCARVYYRHDVMDPLSTFASCPRCMGDKDRGVRDEWRQILLQEPYGQALIDAYERYVPKLNAALARAARAEQVRRYAKEKATLGTLKAAGGRLSKGGA